MYTKQALEPLSILDLRKIARKLDVEVERKTSKELRRAIMSAQQPAGKDGRARPHPDDAPPAPQAAPPRRAARVRSTKPVGFMPLGAQGEKQPMVPNDDASLDTLRASVKQLVRFVGDLVGRVSYLEAALVEKDIIEPPRRAPLLLEDGTAADPGTLPEEWFDDRGELCVTSEDLHTSPFATLQLVNALLPVDEQAEIAHLQRKPRMAAELLTRALEAAGKIMHQDKQVARTRSVLAAAAQAPDPCPPAEKGDQCLVLDDGIWRVGVYTGVTYDEPEDKDNPDSLVIQYWRMKFTDDSGEQFRVDLADDEMRPHQLVA